MDCLDPESMQERKFLQSEDFRAGEIRAMLREHASAGPAKKQAGSD
jgi:hypothetical protein